MVLYYCFSTFDPNVYDIYQTCAFVRTNKPTIPPWPVNQVLEDINDFLPSKLGENPPPIDAITNPLIIPIANNLTENWYQNPNLNSINNIATDLPPSSGPTNPPLPPPLPVDDDKWLINVHRF